MSVLPLFALLRMGDLDLPNRIVMAPSPACKLIANVGMTAARDNRLIAAGLADLVAFGRTYIADPDLVERLATGAPLAEVDWKTVYASGPRGCSDYGRHTPP